MTSPKTREVKIIGTLYVGNKQYPLVRQEQTLGIPANISTWTVIDNSGGKWDLADDGETWINDPPITITTTMPWLVEYHTQDKFVTVLDDNKD